MRASNPFVFASALALWLSGCAGDEATTPADLVLLNGTIATVDEALPVAQALAAKDGRIVAVGTNAEIEPYVGDETRVVDLTGLFAVPGLIEGHGHYMSYGASLMELDLRYAKTWSDIVGMVAEAADTAAPGEWIVGRGWHQDKWDAQPEPSVEGLPVHASLSEASPDHPVFLSHTSGHGVFVNQRALEASGLDADSEDPPGGELLRDAAGSLTGMLREAAAQPARDALADYLAKRSPEEAERIHRRQIQLAADDAVRNGITSFQDMGSTFAEVDLFKKMAGEGALPVRLYIALDETAEVMRDKLADYRMVDHGGGFLTVRAIGEKVLDGALGTHGGWLLEPYSDLPRTSGLEVTPVPEIEASAALAVEHDYQMAIQGIGDRAARELLDIYESAFEDLPEGSDPRWRIEHAQVVHPDDLPRFADLSVIAGIQGIFACSDGPWVDERLGAERTRERGYIYRTMIDAGIVVQNGTDPPVEPIDPIASFDCSVTRRLPDGTIFHAAEAMTREQALYSYTMANAYAAFEENDKGSLTPGKLADVTVLTKNLLTAPDDELARTEVAYTIIGGEVVYENR